MAGRQSLVVGIIVIAACAVLTIQTRTYAMEQTSPSLSDVAPPADPAALRPGGSPPALHTEGNRICGPDGKPVRLEGVDVASLEWTNEGERVMDSLAVAYDQWNCNLVRLPLCQDRWFGRAPGQDDGGAKYRSIVDDAVSAAAKRGRYVLLDLHWNDMDQWGQHIGQHKMPDSGSLLFWKSLGVRYGDNPAVLMGLYNEPHDVSWDVWLNGGKVDETIRRRGRRGVAPAAPPTTVTYTAIGFQQLYDATRAAGAKDNLVVIGGLDWAYDLAPIAAGQYAVKGTNIVYDTHVYPGKEWKPEFKWENAFLKPSEKLPVLVGEWGGGANQQDFVQKFSQLLRDTPRLNWTAWDLHPSAGPTLIKDWTYAPTETGRIVMDMLKSRG
jgi:endoglucanase